MRDLYCEERGLPPDEFVDRFLKETLYPIARVVYPIARILNDHIDKGDRDLIADLGSCSNRDAVRRTLSRLPLYYDNWTFWRCKGKMRVSSRRIYAIIAGYKLP